MKPGHHALTEPDLRALGSGGGGPQVMRTLRNARRSRTLLLIRYIAGASTESGMVKQAYEALTEVQRCAPDAVESVLDHPFTGAWATQAALRVQQGLPAQTGVLSLMAIAAAVRGRVDIAVLLPEMARIPLPTLGVVPRAVSGPVTVKCTPDDTELVGLARIPAHWSQPRPGWHPTSTVAVGQNGLTAAFLLDTATPDQLPATLRVSEDVDVARWRDLLTETWDLLTHQHRQVAEELAAAITVLTPLHEVPGGMTSATLDDAFGCLFLSPAPDARTAGVTLAHELQHTKLIGLMDLLTLLEPVAGERFYAPWRDDPRPVTGLLHGAYAFMGVTAFWRRQRRHTSSASESEHAHTEFARWCSATLTATTTLARSGRLTTHGQAFVAEMAAVLELWSAEPVPSAARRRAAELLDHHRQRYATGTHK
jgi:HEXXH motif-containing protein